MGGASSPGLPGTSGLPGSRSAEALGRLLQTVLALLQTRGRLLATELEEERATLEARVLLAVVAVGAGGFALLLFTMLGIAAFWDTHRLLAIGVAGAVYAGIAAIAVARVLRLGAEKPPMFATTLAELDKDRRALREGTLTARVAAVAAAEDAP